MGGWNKPIKSKQHLKNLLIEANKIKPGDPNPHQERLIKTELLKEDGTFYKSYQNKTYREVSKWYEDEFC